MSSGLRKRRSAQPAHQRGLELGFRAMPRPERLVGIGFRCWMAGYDTGDIHCWELCWSEYARELGAARAKPVLTELSCWVRSLGANASRRIEYFPHGCQRLANDEKLAISMIAACQHNKCPALRACAFHLTGLTPSDQVIETAEGLAEALISVDEVLGLASIDVGAGLAGGVHRGAH